MKANEKTAGWKRAAWLVSKCDKMSRKTKLAFYRELRSLGVLVPEAMQFLISWEIDRDFEKRFERSPDSVRIIAELRKIEDRHGDEIANIGAKAPKRYKDLNARWE